MNKSRNRTKNWWYRGKKKIKFHKTFVFIFLLFSCSDWMTLMSTLYSLAAAILMIHHSHVYYLNSSFFITIKHISFRHCERPWRLTTTWHRQPSIDMRSIFLYLFIWANWKWKQTEGKWNLILYFLYNIKQISAMRYREKKAKGSFILKGEGDKFHFSQFFDLNITNWINYTHFYFIPVGLQLIMEAFLCLEILLKCTNGIVSPVFTGCGFSTAAVSLAVHRSSHKVFSSIKWTFFFLSLPLSPFASLPRLDRIFITNTSM